MREDKSSNFVFYAKIRSVLSCPVYGYPSTQVHSMGIEQADVLKFGGTSVKDSIAIRQSAEVTELHAEGEKGHIIVVSAMSGVTDSLFSAIRNAAEGKSEYTPVIQKLLEAHETIINNLTSKEDANELRTHTQKVTTEVTGILETIYLAKPPLSSIQSMVDYVASTGERLMAPIFAAHLRAKGLPAVAIDSNDIFATNGRYGDAIALTEPSKDKIKDAVLPHLYNGQIVVIPGFYGDHFTTFGRGGSDYSATKIAELLSHFLSVGGVYLYKADVPGALSADPRVVGSEAQLVLHLTYEEAAALAVSGAKILHPRSIGPVKKQGIVLYCGNTLQPSESGTKIDGIITQDDYRAKIVCVVKDLAWLRIKGLAMERPGILAKISTVLAEEHIDIKLINQPISEQAVDLAFSKPEEPDKILRGIKEQLQSYVDGGSVEEISLTNEMAVVEVVGHGISNPDVLGAIAHGLKGTPESPVNNAPGILLSGPVELSVLLEDTNGNANAAVRSIHDQMKRLNGNT